MSKNNTLQKQLLAPVQREPRKHQPPVSADRFHLNLIRAGQQISPEILIQQAESLFDKEHGGEMKALELTQQDLDSRFKASLFRLEALEKQLHAIDEFITIHTSEETDHE
jgi:hypothetical protein